MYNLSNTEDYAIRKIECQLADRSGLAPYKLAEPWQIFPDSTKVEIWYRQYDGKMGIASVKATQEVTGGPDRKVNFSDRLRITRALIRNDQIALDGANTHHFEDRCGANFIDVLGILR